MSSTSNPWVAEPNFVTIGNLSKIKQIHKAVSNLECNKTSRNYQSTTEKYIEQLKEVASLNHQLSDYTFKYQLQNLLADYEKILDMSILDDLISMIDYSTKSLQAIIDNKEQLINKLQKPFVGEYICVDSQHHATVSEFFELIGEQLPQITSCLDNLQWVHSFVLDKSSTSESFDVLIKSLTLYKDLYHVIIDSRNVFKDMRQLEQNFVR